MNDADLRKLLRDLFATVRNNTAWNWEYPVLRNQNGNGGSYQVNFSNHPGAPVDGC